MREGRIRKKKRFAGRREEGKALLAQSSLRKIETGHGFSQNAKRFSSCLLFSAGSTSFGGKLALLDHSSRSTCGSFALVAWYSPYKGRQNRQVGICNFMTMIGISMLDQSKSSAPKNFSGS